MSRAVRRLAVAAVAAVSVLIVSASSAHASTVSDPASNTQPSTAFVNACYSMAATKAANDTCIAAASNDFNAVRAGEGLATMTLPADFDTLSVPFQLLAISNIERVDRGLPPIQGLTSYLNGLALQGAQGDADPPFPSPFGSYGTAGSANWAGAGNSALLDDFYWMYDDGLGSFNGDCYAGHTAGCWGHRHDILMSASSPAVMGAASVPDATYQSSMAEEFIGGYKELATDPVLSPTWAQIAATIPSQGSTTVTLSTHSVSVSADTGAAGHATVTVTAPVDGATVTDKITAGAAEWSVTPASCDLDSNQSCVLHLTFDAPGPVTSYPGTLTVTDSIGHDEVTLSGTQVPPVATIAATKTSVAAGKTVKLTGAVKTGKAHTAMSGQSLVLQRKLAGGTWTDLATKTSDSTGRAVFARHPGKTAKYRVQVRSGSTVEATSGVVKVTVH